MREIVLDTETTGLDPQEGHRIVEIGCVELINGVPSGKTYHQYINPARDVSAKAQEIHGLDEAFLADKPVFAHIADAFVDFVKNSPLIIHNAAFDMKFVNAELAMAGRPVLEENEIIDTLSIARRKFPGAPASLDALCRRFNIDNSAREKHGALLDAELLAEVYLELHGGKQPILDFEADETATAMAANHISDAKPRHAHIRKTALPSRLKQEDIAAHREFIDTLPQQSLWLKTLN